MRSFARSHVTALMLGACVSNHQPPAEPLPESKPVEGRPSKARSSPAKSEPSARTQPSAKSESQSLSGDAKRFVDAHNRYRAKHCAPPLAWSKKLADVAQKWANTLRDKGCIFGHSPGAKYGENLAAGTQGALDPESTVGMWYDEISKYKFPNGGFSMETGHFTQVVWRSTTEVGCGHVTCKGNDIYVCNYNPAGNWEGKYRQEVLPTSCKK